MSLLDQAQVYNMASKSKKGKIIVYMIPESETRDSHTYHYTAYKTKSLIQENKKLKMKKYNPVKRIHEVFVEAKLPKHQK